MYDIDIVWHSHIVHPSKYTRDMEATLGYILNHDDNDQDRTPGSKLSNVSIHMIIGNKREHERNCNFSSYSHALYYE